MERNLRIARELVRIANLIIADEEKKENRSPQDIEKEIEKQVSVKDIQSNPEKALDEIADIVDNPEFDKLVQDCKKACAFNSRRKMLIASKLTKEFGKELNKDEKETYSDTFNQDCFEVVDGKLMVESPLVDDQVHEFDIEDFVEFHDGKPMASEDALEDIYYNLTDKEKVNVRKKITKEITKDRELMKKLQGNEKEITEKFNKKYNNLLIKLKKYGAFLGKNIVGPMAILALITFACKQFGVGQEFFDKWKDIAIYAGLPMSFGSMVSAAMGFVCKAGRGNA